MNGNENYQGRYWLLSWAMITSYGLLAVGVLRLSVIRRDYYKNQARENKVEQKQIPAGRGEILDRKGRVLAKSVYQYYRTEGDSKVYESSGDFQGNKFEGKDLGFDLKRQYTYGESMGLLTGYVGKLTGDEVKAGKCGKKLSVNQVTGRGGVEEYFDCELGGNDGVRLTEVDAKGKYVRELGRQEPELGENITLSIDAYWQDKIYQMLDGKKAAVVVSNPKTGKIISLVSSPAIDANAFSYDQDNQKIKSYLEDKENLPLLNRAMTVKYHPGSVFKIVMATAGLESGMVDKNTLIEDTGIIKIGDYSYSNWLWTKRGTTDGMVGMIKAIQRSNDIYFYKLGEKLGVDRIKEWSNKYGYGQKTGVELAGEVAGLVPDNQWKINNKGDRWYLGDTYHLSIGQGFLDVTPLQVNQSTNVIANNGINCRMSILKDSKSECVGLGIDRDTVATIREGMIAACQPSGTAWPLFNFKTKLACKTGTAEVGDGSKDTHAWLTAFAPAYDPEISITVVVERGGEGSDIAAPIVGDILKEWFNEPDTKVPRYKSETDKTVISE
jgi:penicillin-binding protein 2